jgi:signal peptidase I
MVPTLLPGDRLLVDPRAYRQRRPGIGELVVFVDPEASQRWLIKRVAGVGPGRFWMTRSGLRPAGGTDVDTPPPPEAIELIDLPARTVYVTGDAPAARDSRRFGAVPLDAIIGRAYRRYAPADRRGDL